MFAAFVCATGWPGAVGAANPGVVIGTAAGFTCGDMRLEDHPLNENLGIAAILIYHLDKVGVYFKHF